MKIIQLVTRFFFFGKKRPSSFSEAVSEGIKDFFKEMGYASHMKDRL
jgi:hypothetical protein